MIFLTGDTHGFHDADKVFKLSARIPQITDDKENYLIIAGDFGCIWRYPERAHLKVNSNDLHTIEYIYEDAPFVTLFVDGNHENHKVLNELPVSKKWGGCVHQLTPYCYHLMRGEVFSIQGKTLLAMGGALSVDKDLRKENESWWSEELICQSDYDNAMNNLAKYNNTVDCVVTHTCPTPVALELEKELPPYDTGLWGQKKTDQSCQFLEDLRKQIQFKEWFFGHFHVISDITYDNHEFHCMYNNIKGITD